MDKPIVFFFSLFLCSASLALGQQNRAYTGGNGDGYAMAEIRVYETPTGLKEVFTQAIRVYPNPLAKGESLLLQIEPPARVQRLSFRDLSGKLLFERVLPQQEQPFTLSLPTEKLPAGVYLLQFSSPKGSITRKIILLQN